MKKQFYCLIIALGLCACSGQNAPPVAQQAASAAAAPAEATNAATEHKSDDANVDPAQAELIRKAEALTQEQIQQSREIGDLTKLAQLYSKQGDAERFTWTLERLTQLLPNSGNLRLQLAMAYAGAGDKTRTYDTLLRLYNQGYSYDIGTDPRFEGAHGTRVWDYVVTSLQTNGKPFGEGKVAFELPKGDTLFESIAWDSKRKQFLIGSVREGKIYRADESGKLSDFIAPDATNGLLGVYDMAVDSANDKLYVIANGVPHFKDFNADMFGKAGLWEFNLSSGKFLNKYILPQDGRNHILSSIAADGKGNVYVADGVNQQIFHLDGGALKLVVGNPVLTGIRGMTISADGKILYFADVSLGIFGIDLATLKPFNLLYSQDRLTLGGIGGLYWYDGTLIAIQNDISPRRVMRLKLSIDGHSIADSTPLDAANPAFGVPTVGTVSGDALYFIADSQKGLYSALGVLTDADKLEPVRIFRSDLRFGMNNAAAPAPALPRAPPKKYTREELQKMLKEPPKGFETQTPANDAEKKTDQTQKQD